MAGCCNAATKTAPMTEYDASILVMNFSCFEGEADESSKSTDGLKNKSGPSIT